MDTKTREAACHCGQLRLTVTGEPFAVSICNCRACQRRTGSAFGMQAGFKADQVEIQGRFHDHTRISDEADRNEHLFHFCPDCGSQVFYTEPSEPDLVVVSTGSFADSSFPPPTESGYDHLRHPWIGIPDSVERNTYALWDEVQPLYDAGEFEQAAQRGADLLKDYPEEPRVLYNVACCESRLGRPDEAIEHLRRAIGRVGRLRALAADDPDFEPIRGDARFRELLE